MARRHSIAQRQRVATGDDENTFLERTIELGGWAQQNRQALTIGAIVAGLAVVAAIYYWNFRKTQGDQAAIQLEQVEAAVAVGDSATSKRELASYIEKFGSTPYADEARVILGQMYLTANQADDAVKALQPASDPSEPLGRQAAVLLAKSYEQQGKADDAEKLLLSVADKSNLDFEKRDALEEAARIRQHRGNLAGAAELYQKILDGMKETEPGRSVYEMRLEEIKAAQTKG
jgi:predicted negative regulator of RcsB-dependent stress response